MAGTDSGARETVAVGRHGRVATVRLNRPEQRNALTVPMLETLTAVFRDLASEPETRVVILAGAGADFCAGADLAELERARAGGADSAFDFDGPFAEALDAIATHPVPVIAQVQGRALGGGCQLVLACDLAVAEGTAWLGIPSARLGVVIPLASVRRLVAAVGPRRAAELLCTARAVGAEEAAAWGLVTRVAPSGSLEASTRSLADDVAAAAPLSVRASKRGVAASLEADTDARGVAGFEMMAAAALASEDLAEGIAAFRANRAPRFEGR